MLLETAPALPARVVWGAADQFQKLHYGERLARDLDAPLRRIDGGKHFTPEDHPHKWQPLSTTSSSRLSTSPEARTAAPLRV